MKQIKKLYHKKNLKPDEIVLDIETTGLSFFSDKLVLLGIITFEDNKFYINQFFAEYNNEEKELLKIYLKKIDNKKLFTYNGDVFDIPFLNSRLSFYGLEKIFVQNTDIYKIVTNYRKYFDFKSLKLEYIEKIIKINRDDPKRINSKSLLKSDLEKRINSFPILKHNENDLISTEKLINISDTFDNELSFFSKKLKSKITLKNISINKDLCFIEFFSEKKIDMFLSYDDVSVSSDNNLITLTIKVIYGKI
ncbi:MAG: ribonuclease H-like domain-containing protein [Peptoniphilaceae bacterium]|nr:ribonuclease H-like domain-containing protein [Peptoniphilaceae bacterium]